MELGFEKGWAWLLELLVPYRRFLSRCDILITRSHCVAALVCFNGHCQYTHVLGDLRAIIFGLMPCGWLLSLTLTPSSSGIPHESIVSDLCLLFQEHNCGVWQGLVAL
jgi:hypothetical protein